MKNGRNRVLLILALLLISITTVSGCTPVGSQIAQGWAGGVVSDGTIFVGSMEGKLVALGVSDGSLRGDPVTLVAQAQSSGFGCVPTGSSAVAIYGSPVVDGDLVFIGGYDGKVRAYLFESGRLRAEPRWISRQGDIGGSIIGGLAVADGRIYFGASDGKVYALDAVDGHRLWTFETGGKIWSTPTVEGDTLYIGSFDGKLYALDVFAKNNEERLRWEQPFETEGTIVSAPVVSGGMVYIGSFDRRVYAVDATSGGEVWRFPETDDEVDTPIGWFWASLLVHNGAVYAPNLDGRVYVIDATSGNRISNFDLEGPISSAPVLVNDRVIVATTSTNRAKQEGKVFALDTTSRQQTMLQDIEESIHAPLFADGTTVYVHTMGNFLYAIDTETGAGRKYTLSAETSE
ncbi:MAG: PQQ-like beta-propeller repeat protein [Dehalococcoidales bacterium]|nr:PQQ-like beta-propeller repeat protein [Dehalococcoidales bacterium]